MPESGLFITLFDEKTLSLYLDRGVYGFHMRPEQTVSQYSRHFQALGDYACARNGTHIFFFLKRHIVYAGQVDGSTQYGAFFLNGNQSPLGSKINAPLVWDESMRGIYKAQGAGIFTRPNLEGENKNTPVCQPYLIMFTDKLGLKGKAIRSDQLYLELGEFPYPLPTNSISGMGFCTMAPAEVKMSLNLLQNNSVRAFPQVSNESVSIHGEPLPFSPSYGISSPRDALNEAHLEASLLANPQLFPQEVRTTDATFCRQVPICPFKPPKEMDRADICFYTDETLSKGSIPNAIIELKNQTAGRNVSEQVVRYADWLRRRLGAVSLGIKFYVLAPAFASVWNVPVQYRTQIMRVPF